MGDIVTLENVRLTLGGFEALRGVNVAFAEGRSTVIMGPSGCGKSTLLKVAAGLIPPDSGNVLLRGQDIFQDFRTPTSRGGWRARWRGSARRTQPGSGPRRDPAGRERSPPHCARWS